MEMSDSLIGGITRLKDPANIVTSPRRLEELQDKISACMTKLFQKPGNGGNPFLFTLCGPKSHYLATELGGGHKLETAATDGKSFFWNPDFLEALDSSEVVTTMFHEGNHVLFFHCDKERCAGRDKERWNVAADYVSNSVIERHHQRANEEARSMGKSLPKLWGLKKFGEPILLKELLDWIDGKLDKMHGEDNKDICTGYSDPACIDRSPESVYEEIQLHEQNSPRKCQACGALSIDPKTKLSKFGPAPYAPGCCPKCGCPPQSGRCYPGSSPDEHMDPSLTKDQVMGEMMRAAESAEAIGRGMVPAEIEAALAELKRPTLSARDIIVNAFQRRCIDVRTPPPVHLREGRRWQLHPKAQGVPPQEV
jgi:hypothetical protein